MNKNKRAGKIIDVLALIAFFSASFMGLYVVLVGMHTGEFVTVITGVLVFATAALAVVGVLDE